MAKTWLDYTSLSDHYERKARFLPSVLSLLPILPAVAALGGPFLDWIDLILGGLGIGAVVAVGLSHVASAMGNRLQKKLWPRWPHDSPTNRWLNPIDETTSPQQRALWYGAAKRLVGIDIQAAVESGEVVEATIQDAVAALRSLFWDCREAERLRMHNIDYGFARNLTGMRPIWLWLLLISVAACWGSYWWMDADDLTWAVVATVLAIVLIPLSIWVLPGYVRAKATYYAESFFGTLRAVDAARTQQSDG